MSNEISDDWVVFSIIIPIDARDTPIPHKKVNALNELPK